MKAFVDIGRSQKYRLEKALLVYGQSDYNFYPARHPFLTLHSVVHNGQEPSLGVGELVTPNALIDLLESLGQEVKAEILPANILVRTSETLIWWIPAGQHLLFFNDRGSDKTMTDLNGKKYPNPALVFRAAGSCLWVRALAASERPTAETPMYMAPYWNCYANGVVCNGSMRIPQQKSLASMRVWEDAFFNSEFTHATGNSRQTRHPRGFLAMWKYLQGKKTFPSRYLVNVKQTLAEFVACNDTSYSNGVRTR
jgi:PRTRC genetic system protein B